MGASPIPPAEADLARADRLNRTAAAAAASVAAALIAVKAASWWITGSVALLSSLVDSVLDLGMSLITVLAVHQAAKPADREHRWGHGKLESVSALAQSVFIAVSAILILVECGQRLLEPAPVRHEALGIATAGAAILVSAGLVWFQGWVVQRTRSMAIAADRAHYLGDLVVNVGVILSFVVAGYGGIVSVDPVIAAVIALWLASNAWAIGRHAVDQLMDRELPDTDRTRIRDIALGDEAVKAVRDLRTRSSGADTFVQMILVVDGSMSVDAAHRVVDRVERAVCAAFPSVEVLIHEEPGQLPEEQSTARRPGSRHDTP